jgi:hypothetical protein
MDSAGLEWNSYWSQFYWSYSIFPRVFRCWNFTLTEKVRPSLLRMVMMNFANA